MTPLVVPIASEVYQQHKIDKQIGNVGCCFTMLVVVQCFIFKNTS